MLNLMDADLPVIGVLYIFLIIIIGQFFLMNLILAVIIFSFIKSQKQFLENEVIALDDYETNVN